MQYRMDRNEKIEGRMMGFVVVMVRQLQIWMYVRFAHWGFHW